jgi:NAD(P)-dependent dehydrogenase (short-subunit alcohol dehydrogenase family)
MRVRLDGKVALVTGATSGIGRAIATLFVARGASVVGMARRRQPGEALAREIAADGGSFFFVAGDITRPEDCERAVAAALEWRGKLDILINNAARTVPTGRIE